MEVDPKQIARQLDFQHLGWGDAEAAELLVALRYAAAKCAFPEGAVTVVLKVGNLIHLNVKATLPPHLGDTQTEQSEKETDAAPRTCPSRTLPSGRVSSCRIEFYFHG